MSSNQQQMTSTLVIQPNCPLGKALKLVMRSFATSSPNAIRLVEQSTSTSNMTMDCIATNLGAGFVYVESEEHLKRLTNATVSFRLTVVIVNLSMLFADKQNSARSQQAMMEFQRRSRMMNPIATNSGGGAASRTKSILAIAHNAEEAAEYVLSMVARLGDTPAVEQAKRWVEEGFVKQNTAYDPKQQAFMIAEKGFPIPPRESRALLESMGSLLTLAQVSSAEQIALRSPLSDHDAHAVALVMGIPSSQRTQPQSQDGYHTVADTTAGPVLLPSGIARFL